eukprot:6424703-Alexandrium_andersonii.AAC.1
MLVSTLIGLWRASAAILSAAKAAGLAVELHSCRGGQSSVKSIGKSSPAFAVCSFPSTLRSSTAWGLP